MFKIWILGLLISSSVFALPPEPKILFGFTDFNGHYILFLKQNSVLWGNINHLNELRVRDLSRVANEESFDLYFEDVRIPPIGLGWFTMKEREITIHHRDNPPATFGELDREDIANLQRLIDEGQIKLSEAGRPGWNRPAEFIYEVGTVSYYFRFNRGSGDDFQFQFAMSEKGNPFKFVTPGALVNLETDVFLSLPYEGSDRIRVELGLEYGRYSCKSAISMGTGESLDIKQLDPTSPNVQALLPPLLQQSYTPFDILIPNCETALNPETSEPRH